jgi:hypothetical protein
LRTLLGSTQGFDHCYDVLPPIPLSAGKVDQLPDLRNDSTSLRCPGDGHATSSLEIEDALVAKGPERPENGIRVNAEHGGNVAGWRETLAGSDLTFGNVPPNLGGHLLMQWDGLVSGDLDIHDGDMQSITIVRTDVELRSELKSAADPELVIREARRRQRRRWLLSLGVVLVLVASSAVIAVEATPGGMSAPPQHPPAAKTPAAAFIASAKHALTGTFSEVYRVTGPSSGTVTLYQQAPAGVNPVPMGRGGWAFVYLAANGISSQWIEKGATAWDCWQPATTAKAYWACSGPGHFEEANGFALATQPYIPGVVGGEINALETGLKVRAIQVRGIEVSTVTSLQFGRLRCLHVDGITTCIDRSGILVSQRGGTYWTSISLVRRSSSLPPTAFVLFGKSASRGRGFVLPPV